jgi:toxin YoeB
MGQYIIQFSKQAIKDLQSIKKSGKKSDKDKIDDLLSELEKHPREGKGQPEQLKHYEGEVWSRKINKKDRLVYEIYEKTICITIIQALGHYNDN